MRTGSFGRWVREARNALDLTQDALAERTGCAVQTIRKIEAGERRPSQQMAKRLAHALALPSEELGAFLHAARAPVVQPPAPPAATPPTPPPRLTPALPPMHTRFIGRHAELSEVRLLLADPDRRLLSLVGPGGIGKTRLALEAVKDCSPFADGVVFVPLAPINTVTLLAPTIADAAGFTFSGPESPATQLLRYLESKELLLILDNLEHLLSDTLSVVPTSPDTVPDAAHLLARILGEARRVKVLVTSRERVSLRGEWVVQLVGLPIGQADAPGYARDADAMVLFAERARQVQHDFQITPANRPLVAQICRLLEGMPLGIELAATWVRILSCWEIVAELERGLNFLQASTRDLPERHRSMRAVFEHSWQLLHAEEQQVLRRLAVFRGGFTREAAAAVAGAALAVLAVLVDKSLVRRTGAERYDLHEVVRQGAATHLEHDHREATATRDRHAAYFAALLAERDRLLKSRVQRATVTELTAEIDNVRAAWHWATQRRRLADLRLAIPTLYYFHEIRNWYQEAANLFRQAADTLQTTAMEAGADEEQRLLLGELLALQGWFAFRYSEFELARELAERSLALLGQQTTAAALSEALPFLWTVRYTGGDYAHAEQLLRLRIQLLRVRGERFAEAGALLHLGTLKQEQGDPQEAYRLLREALVLFRAAGDPVMIARSLALAAGPAHVTGAFDEARELASESLAISRGIDDHFSIGLALHTLGVVAHVEGRYGEARSLLEESVAFSMAISYRWHIPPVLGSLAKTLHAQGAIVEARRALLEALAAAREARSTGHMLEAVLGLAAVFDDQGATGEALTRCLHILNHPESSQQQRAKAERLRSRLEATLPALQVAGIEAGARDQSFEMVVAELLANHPPGRSTSSLA